MNSNECNGILRVFHLPKDWRKRGNKAYFDTATKDIWACLSSYANDYKEGRLTKNLARSNNEHEVGSNEDLREKGMLPLKLKEWDDNTRARLRQCFRALSTGNGLVSNNDETAFVNIFSDQPVKHKVIWKATTDELAYFIENIKEELESSAYLSEMVASCFSRPKGRPLLMPRSYIDVVKNANKKKGDETKVYEKKIEEYRLTKPGDIEKLDKAIKKFKER